MKEYIREREKQEKTSRMVGAGLAAGISVCAILFCSFTGFKYIYPPPQENTFVIDFTEEVETVVQHRRGNQPQAEEIELLATKYKIPRADATNIVKAANNVRDVAAKGDLELSVTTRETIRAAKKVAAGYTAQKAMERTFLPRFEGTLSEGSRSVVWQIIISN